MLRSPQHTHENYCRALKSAVYASEWRLGSEVRNIRIDLPPLCHNLQKTSGFWSNLDAWTLKCDTYASKCRSCLENVEKQMDFGKISMRSAHQDQKRIEKHVFFAKFLPKSTTVQRFGRVRTLKYRFLQRKMRKMSAAPDPADPGYPDDPVHGLLLGTYHPHAPESRWRKF